MSQQAQPTPPLLFTKRLTSFLGTYLSPSTHTLLLTTSTGKLLAHAASPPAPASVLRGRATVAAGLMRMYQHASPRQRQQQDNGAGEEDEQRREGEGAAGPVCVTVQMAEGVFAVRRLECGLLLVCVGPEDGGASAAADEGDSVTSVGLGSVSVRRVGEEVGRALEARLPGLRLPGDVVGAG